VLLTCSPFSAHGCIFAQASFALPRSTRYGVTCHHITKSPPKGGFDSFFRPGIGRRAKVCGDALTWVNGRYRSRVCFRSGLGDRFPERLNVDGYPVTRDLGTKDSKAAGGTRVLSRIQREAPRLRLRTFLSQFGDNLPLAPLSALASCLVAHAQCCERQWRPR
jgi:hypothetical protein